MTTTLNKAHHLSKAALAAALVVAFAGCSKPSATLDGALSANTTSVPRLEGPIRIEGPIKLDVQITGPFNNFGGVYISEALLGRVIIGGARQDWLLADFGEPTLSTLDDSSEIWRWTYKPLQTQASLLSLFGSKASNAAIPEPSTTFVRLEQRLVIEKRRG